MQGASITPAVERPRSCPLCAHQNPPLSNSGCRSQGGNFTPKFDARIADPCQNVCVDRVFSHDLAAIGHRFARMPEQKMRDEQRKGCKCALLEAHLAECCKQSEHRRQLGNLICPASHSHLHAVKKYCRTKSHVLMTETRFIKC